ncbi:hypothetical protein QFZ24_005900 [Streptomyces phaeochromogenes]|nr:hypothetical protein [Streptomyces phaeochromogenes]
MSTTFPSRRQHRYAHHTPTPAAPQANSTAPPSGTPTRGSTAAGDAS